MPSSRRILFSVSSLPTGTDGWGRLGSSSISSSSLASAPRQLGGFALDVALDRRALGDRALALGPGRNAADLLRHLVLRRLQRLRLVLEVAHARIGGYHAVDVDRRAEPRVGLADLVGGFTQQMNIDHGAGA